MIDLTLLQQVSETKTAQKPFDGASKTDTSSERSRFVSIQLGVYYFFIGRFTLTTICELSQSSLELNLRIQEFIEYVR